MQDGSLGMSKIQTCLVTFGVVIGIVGILHGSAAMLQGSTLVESHYVEALPEDWPNSEFYTVMRGSPVFSLLTGIPYFVLGLLAISVSTTLIVVSVTFLRGGSGLSVWGLSLFALLNVGVFFFGAGVGTPFAVGLPVLFFGALSMVMTGKKRSDSRRTRILSSSFYLFYWLQILSWVLVFPGLFVLSFYGSIPQALFLFDLLIMPISILGALIAGLLHDKTIHDSA
jgi:hypothetical protein